MARKKSSQETKTVHVTRNRMMVLYTNTNKHFVYYMPKDSPTKEIVLFGKTVQVQDQTPKTDFLTPCQRELFNDLLFARQHMSEEEIAALPGNRKHRVTNLSVRVEKVLNQWKKELIMTKLDTMLSELFPNSPVIRQFVQAGYDETSRPLQTSIHSLADDQQIVRYLQSKGLFPQI